MTETRITCYKITLKNNTTISRTTQNVPETQAPPRTALTPCTRVLESAALAPSASDVETDSLQPPGPLQTPSFRAIQPQRGAATGLR